MIIVRPSNERGPADLGWLESRHTFSFGSYHDSRYMGVSDLRVINDDVVIPGKGFGTHSHQDMEILSYVKKGTIAHKDSMGNVEKLPPGEFQLMSAGTGVTHSEFNPSDTETLEFLQIWIVPNQKGIKPQYQQKKFPEHEGLQLILSPNGRDGSLTVHQDMTLYQLRTKQKQQIEYNPDVNRTLYIHVIAGEIEVLDTSLTEGDGATIKLDKGQTNLTFNASENAEALLFDLTD
ncbi:MAG: pirin family protein [Thiotrichales bacterium]|nr:MAG: pirin family protein [Thiotrichales bacterium]